MVSEMVQNSQSLYSFTFNTVIFIHEYIYSHSTIKFSFNKYNYSHLTTYFFFTNLFIHIYEIHSSTFNALYSFTFTIEIFVQHGHNIHSTFSAHQFRADLAHLTGHESAVDNWTRDLSSMLRWEDGVRPE